MHLSWVTAHLSEDQISIGVIAVTQACCEPVLQSTTEQWGMHFAHTSAALQFYWLTAQLHEEHNSIGVIAVAQACCEASLQSSTEQQGSYFALTRAAVHWSRITAHLYEEQNLHRCRCNSAALTNTAAQQQGLTHCVLCLH